MTITSNPACNLKLKRKGRVAVGCDADLCILDQNLCLRGVIAKGVEVMKDGIVVKKGRYEV